MSQAVVVGEKSKPTMPQLENKGGVWSCFVLMTVENATPSAVLHLKQQGNQASWQKKIIDSYMYE